MTKKTNAPISSKLRSRLGSARLIAGVAAALCCALPPAPASAQGIDEPRLTVRAFEIEGDLPIPRESAQAALAPFTGDNVSLTDLRKAARALEVELSARGYSFYRVVLAPQALDTTVTLRVLPFRLGNVALSGNKYFPDENILASLPSLRKGESPNVATVARDRAVANEHPSKEVEVNFVQSETPDTIDAQVKVTDEPPLRFFTGLNNTGEPRTGRWRATVGVQHSNLWNLDHAVTASFTTSPSHFDDVKQYGLYYRIPIYRLGGALNLFYAYSDVASGTVANVFEVSGRGNFAGIRYRQHLVPIGAYAHAFEVGLDDRYFDNNVVFGGAQQLGIDVRSRPVTLAYQGRLERAAWNFGGRLDYVRNLTGGKANSDAAYAGNRAGASPDWHALRIGLDGQWRIPQITFNARVRAQTTDEPLVPGEQFGLGGVFTVRGLREREVTGDSGFAATIEALVPTPVEGVYGAVFIDGGRVWSKNVPVGIQSREGAVSIGVGVRWIVARKFSLSVDAAYLIDGATLTDSSDSRVHASAIYFF